MSDFPSMLDRMLETPIKLAMIHPEKVGFCNLLILWFQCCIFEGLLEADDVKRKEHHQAMFKTYNPKGDDRMCLDEWIRLAMESVYKKMVA